MKETDILVLGAGVSGLGFAQAASDRAVTVLEKEETPGGYCRTTIRNGFVWDFSGHFFHFATPEIRDYFTQRIPDDELVHARKNTKIYYNGRYIDYPFQKNIHQLDKREFIDCLYALYFREKRECYQSFSDMLYGRFGSAITEKFLKPYNEKLYACSLESLDADAMGRFFPYADFDAVMRNMKAADDDSYNQTFLYPKKGANMFVQALLRDVRDVRLGCAALRVDAASRTVYTNEGEYRYRKLVSTLPLPTLLGLMGKPRPDALTGNQVLVLNLGFDRKSAITDVHWVYVPQREFPFYRVGFYDNILGQDRMSLYVELGFARDHQPDAERELAGVLDGLRRMGVVNGQRLIDHEARVMDPAYVHVSGAGQRCAADVKRALESEDIYTLGRYGDWKYCSIEDCILDARALAARLTTA